MMAVGMAANPEKTRPDQRLPDPPADAAPADAAADAPDASAGAPAPDSPVPPPSPEAPVPPAGGPGTAEGQGGRSWHRMHYAVGVFLLAYGVTGIVSAVLLWDDRQDEFEKYFASGPAGTLLIVVKAVEVLLVVGTAAGLARRRDMWFVPVLAGWMAGFAMFAVLDVLKGRWGGLLEHVLYLAGFVVLLFLSYGLSAKAQLAAAARARREAGGQGIAVRSGGGLTRTQEFALSAINRLPRR